MHENHWLRSWSNNTYLWYDEIIDQDPANFTSTLDYFDELVTLQTTASGQLKDKFHFTYEYDEWQQLTRSGISAGYGANFAVLQSSPPRKVLVSFTEPNTPATTANLERGAEILEIDGVDLVNAGDQASVDIINGGLFPSDANESHTFLIRDLGATETRSITMTSAEITKSPVQYTSSISTETGNVGYMLFTTHIATAEEQLVNAVNQLKADNINDLVLDLRYNGGGLLDIASELAYMIAGATPTQNQTFDNLIFNDKHTSVNPVTGQTLSPTPFHSSSQGFSVDQGQALPTLDLERVFILSTSRTCSASEAIINGLRGVDVEVILIGSTTCGKPYGFYATDNCGTTYFTIQFRGSNAKGFGDYSDGFSPENTAATVGEVVPGCSVADDFTKQLGDSEEAQLKAALDYRDTGSCPTPTAKGVGVSSTFNKTKSNNNDSIKIMSSSEQARLLNNSIYSR
ncbi:MAG: S41 family peptidase [Kangiellaceae bacterium]